MFGVEFLVFFYCLGGRNITRKYFSGTEWHTAAFGTLCRAEWAGEKASPASAWRDLFLS